MDALWTAVHPSMSKNERKEACMVVVEQYEASLIDLMTAAAQFGRVDIVIDDDDAIGENKQNTHALASRQHVHTYANTYTHIFLFYTYPFFFTRTSSSKSTRTLLVNTHTYIQHAHCLGSKHALCTRTCFF